MRTKVDHGQRRQWVTEQLLGDALRGKLAAGKHLVIQELAKRYSVSATPIREALVALEGFGLVELHPNRGAIVRELTASDIREICQVRRALECAAIRGACGRVDLGIVEALHEQCTALAAVKRPTAKLIDKARRLDNELHDMIAASCGNRHLARELERLKVLFRAGRDAAWDSRLATGDYLRIIGEAKEHLAILEALRDNDAKAASRALALHIRAGMKYWTRQVALTK